MSNIKYMNVKLVIMRKNEHNVYCQRDSAFVGKKSEL